MNWIIAQTGLPGEQLAQSVLNADALHTMQLIVFLLVLAGVLQTYLSSRSVNQMSQTQAGMGRANERFFEADAKRTAVMQAQVDEQRMMREAYERTTLLHQASVNETKDAVRLHDEKAESHLQTILNHASTLAVAQTKNTADAVTDLIGEATVKINEATVSAVEGAGKTALEAINELKALNEALRTLQQEQMSLMKRQQDAQMDALKDLFDSQMQILNTQIDRTEKRIVLAINLGRQPHDNTESITPPPAGPEGAGPLLPDGTASDGAGIDSRAP
jgi:hypothetical protein